VYRRTGVKEYLVWRVEDQAIDWLILRGGRYERLPHVEGLYLRVTFPGLWLDAAAMVGADLRRVQEVLQEGLTSAEDEAFLARLQEHLATGP
jgi:hypothetical protein